MSDRGRWWSSYFVNSKQVQVEVYGQTQTFQASTSGILGRW